MRISPRLLAALVGALASLAQTVAGAWCPPKMEPADTPPPAITLPPEVRTRPGRIAKITAICAGKVRWLNVHDDLDLIESETGRWVIVSASRPGRYRLAAYTADKDGPSEPAYCVVVVEGNDPAPPPPPAPPSPEKKKGEPKDALGKLRFGSGGCTATVVSPRRTDGRWDILTAAHCTGGPGSRGTFTLKDGRTIGVSVAARNTRADICWLVTDSSSITDLPSVPLARDNPPPSTAVWHAGYGIDKPGNVEEGYFRGGPNSDGQYEYILSVSPGDSGGGIFRKDTGELLSPVCCTASLARKDRMWGGSPLVAAGMRPKPSAAPDHSAYLLPEPDGWKPVEMPVYRE